MSNQSDPEFNQQPRVVAFPHLDKTTALKSKKLSASDVCLQQANKLCQDGNLAGAIPFYRQALQLKPDSQEACQKLAEALKQQGNTEEAGIYFRQAIALNTANNTAKDAGITNKHQEQQLSQVVADIAQKSDHAVPLNSSIVKLDSQGIEAAPMQLADEIDSESPNLAAIINNYNGFIEPSQWQRQTRSSSPVTFDKEERIARSYLEQALADADGGQWSQAIAACDRAIEITPNLAEAYKVKGNLLQTALKFYLQEIERNPNELDNYRQALKIKPNQVELYIGLAQALVAREQIEEAIATYQQAIKIEPSSALVYRHLAELLEQQGDRQQAADYLYQAIQIDPEGVTVDSYLNLGHTFIARKHLTAAEDCYRRALLLADQLVEPYLCLGTVLSQQQKWQELVKLYQQAIAVKPSSADFHRLLGDALTNNQQWSEAFKHYHQAVSLKSNCWRAYHGMGDALLNLEQWQRAINCYQKALSINPDSTWSYHNLSVALVKLQRYSEAFGCYQKINQLVPNFWQENQSNFDVQRQLADILFHQERWQQASKIYQQAIKLQPDAFSPHHNLGKVYYNLRQWEQAIASFKQAVKLNVNCAWSYYYLGEIYARQEQWELAVDSYRRAVDLQSNLPEVRDKLSHALHQQTKTN